MYHVFTYILKLVGKYTYARLNLSIDSDPHVKWVWKTKFTYGFIFVCNNQ